MSIQFQQKVSNRVLFFLQASIQELLLFRNYFYLFFFLCVATIYGYGQNIYTIAGNGRPGYSGDGGTAIQAQLFKPFDIALDEEENLYIADSHNHRIRKIGIDGTITTVAGKGSPGFSGDGGPATEAKLFYPNSVYPDEEGNLYIADSFNNRIRKVDSSGIITTIAGTGWIGFSGDNGPATQATLFFPLRITGDANGNLYFADSSNDVIRKIDTNGIITTVAGIGRSGYSGDGGVAKQARLKKPMGICLDGEGNLYIADTGNEVIRKVDTQGVITTIVDEFRLQNDHDEDDDENSVAEKVHDDHGRKEHLQFPTGIFVDALNNLFIADSFNHRILKRDNQGKISRIAGNDEQDFEGDGDLAVLAQLHNPRGIAGDSEGNIYIADRNNNRVRMIGVNISVEAGSQRQTYVNNPIQLFGEVEGGTGQYGIEWSVVEGPNHDVNQFSETNVLEPLFTPTIAGTYILRLSVTDGLQPAVVDTMEVNVYDLLTVSIHVNDQLYLVGDSILLDSGSEGGTGENRYSWSILSGPDLSLNQFSSSAEDSTFTPSKAGTYVLQVSVSDGLQPPVREQISVQVYNTITVSAGNEQVTIMNRPISLDGEASGGDGTFTYSWTVQSGPDRNQSQFSSASIEDPVFTPTKPGVYVLQLSITDGLQTWVSSSVTITVYSALTVDAGDDQETFIDHSVTLQGIAGGGSGHYDYEWTIHSGPNTDWDQFSFAGGEDDSSANEVPETIKIIGTIRDFRKSHPDFQSFTGNQVDANLVESEIGNDRTPVFNLDKENGKITSAETFYQWYHDDTDVNRSKEYEMELSRVPDSSDDDPIYTIEFNKFFPIDNQLFGNDGNNHNFHFTYEFHTQFVYRGPQEFRFSGDDDVWVFVNDQLALDLGGPHPELSGSFNTGDLGLTVGETYPLDFFFAERHTDKSRFRLQTGLILGNAPPPVPTELPQVVFTPKASGNYILNLVVNDGVQAPVNDKVEITVYDFLAADAGEDRSSYVNNSIALNGDATGGSGTFSYEWSIVEGPNTDPAQFSDLNVQYPIFTPTLPGTYTLRIEVNDGMQPPVDDTVELTVHELMTVDASGSGDGTQVSGGELLTFVENAVELSSQVSGGSGNNTYEWSITSGPSLDLSQFSSATAANPIFISTASGRYIVQVSVDDGLQPPVSQSLVIEVYGLISVNVGADRTGLINNLYPIDAKVSGGSGSYTYTWEIVSGPSMQLGQFSLLTEEDPVFVPQAVGDYVLKLTVSDGIQPPASDLLVLSVHDLLRVNAGDDVATAILQPVELNGSVNGGSGDYSYQWKIKSGPSHDPQQFSSLTEAKPVFTPKKSGTYELEFTVDDGLQEPVSDRVIVTVHDVLTVDVGVDVVTFDKEPVSLNAEVEGGSGEYVYNWSIEDGPASDLEQFSDVNVEDPTFTPDEYGKYILKISVDDGIQPSATDSITITSRQTLNVDIGPDLATYIENPVSLTSDVEGGSGNFNYRWDILSGPNRDESQFSLDGSGYANEEYPETITLVGTIRDLKDSHPDFQTFTGNSVDAGLVKDTLGEDGKPVFNLDKENGKITSADTFYQWYHDVPGVNESTEFSIVLTHDPDSPDDNPIYSIDYDQFFPIDGQLFGNQNRNHNFHFTFEFHSSFVYHGPQEFTFSGDDDVWVFIDNQLALDLGGPHPELSGTINTGDLGLEVGETYPLDFFFAERHTTQSHFRIHSGLLFGENSTPDPSLQPDVVFTPTDDGLYEIQLTVNDGSQSTVTDTVLVTVHDLLAVNAGSDQVMTLGNPISLNSQPSGGTGEYSFEWNIVSGPNTDTVAFSSTTAEDPEFSPAAIGTYELQVTVDDGMQPPVSDTVSITVHDVISVEITDGDAAGTFLDTVVGDAIVLDAEVSGGSGNYTYTWDITSGPDEDNGQLSSATVQNPTFTPTAAGTYTIELTVDDGVQAPVTVTSTVLVYDLLSVNAGSDRTAFILDPVSLNAEVTGGSGDYSYTWAIASGPNSDESQFSATTIEDPVFTPSAGGIYALELTVADGIQPSASDTLLISVRNAVTADAGPDRETVVNNPISITGTAEGGSGNYTFDWNILSGPNTDPSQISIASSGNQNDGPPETITLSGTIRDFQDSHPDFQYKVATEKGIVLPQIGEDRNPVFDSSKSFQTVTTAENFNQWYNDVQDINQATDYEVVLTLDPDSSPANPIYTIDVDNFFPIDEQLFGNEGRKHNYHFTFEIHAQFVYNGPQEFTFSGDDDVWVFIDDQLVIDLGGVHPEQTATINTGDLGLTEGETYSFDFFFAERHTVASHFRITSGLLFSDGQTPYSPDNSTITFTPTDAGVYVVQMSVDDGHYPPVTDSLTVTVPEALSVDAGPDQAVYLNEPIDLGVTVSGGTGDYEYEWEVISGANTAAGQLSSTSIPDPVFTPTAAGTYELKVTVNDGMQDPESDSVNVTVYEPLVISVDPAGIGGGAGSGTITFVNESIVLDGQVSGGSGDYFYEWSILDGPNSSDGQFSSTTVEDPTFTPAAPGTYTIELNVSDGDQSSGSITITVDVYETFTVDAGANQVTFITNSVALNGTVNGGSGSYTYMWSILSGPSSDQSQISQSDIEDPLFTPAAAGTYTLQLTVNDDIFSPVSDTVTVVVQDFLSVDAGPNQESYVTNPVTLNGTVSGGSGDYTVQWSIESGDDTSVSQFSATNVEDPVFTPTRSGTYILQCTARDGIQPSKSDTVTLIVYPLLEVQTDEDQLTYVNNGITLAVEASGGTGDYAYYWEIVSRPDGDTTQLDAPIRKTSPSKFTSNPRGDTKQSNSDTNNTIQFTPKSSGVYELRLTVEDGMQPPASDTVMVTVHELLSVDAGEDQTIDVDLTLPLDAMVQGGSGDYTYHWAITSGPSPDIQQLSSTEIEDPAFTPSDPGPYILQLTVNDGIQPPVSDSVAITAELPFLVDAGEDQIVLVEQFIDLNGTIDGNPGTYTYLWEIVTGPDESDGQFSSPLTEDPIFHPIAAGVYELKLTVTNGDNRSVSDTVTITVYQPVAVDAGPSIFSVVNKAFDLEAQAVGGDGTYSITWRIKSGPSLDLNQFSSTNDVETVFTPVEVGTYVLELTVDDGIQEAVQDTLGFQSVSLNTLSRVIVTDHLEELKDLSNQEDFDPRDSKELVVRWVFSPLVVDDSDIKDVHLYISENDEEYKYLGRSGSESLTHFEWKKGSTFETHAHYAEGPQYENKYRFKIFVLTKSKNPLFFGPFLNSGNVYYAFGADSVPPTPFPTATATAEPTLTPTPTDVSLPDSGDSSTRTPTVTETVTPTATNTPVPSSGGGRQPTDTPTATVVATATATHTETPVSGRNPNTATPTFTPTATNTALPTHTERPGGRPNTHTPTFTPTATPTSTISPPFFGQPSNTPLPQRTQEVPTPTSTPNSFVPTETNITPSPISTEQPTNTPTISISVTDTPTTTPTSVSVPQPTITTTFTPVNTPMNTVIPTETTLPGIADTATPTPTKTPVPTFTSTPTNTGTRRPTPTMTITNTPLSNPPATFTPTNTPKNSVIFTFEELTGFADTCSFTTGEVPLSEFGPVSTDGFGIQAVVPGGQLCMIYSPEIQVTETPVKLTCWFYVTNDLFMYALGGFTKVEGQTGAVAYNIRYAPEMITNTWQKVEFDVDAKYTSIQPFIAIYNGDDQGGMMFIDNLEVSQGVRIGRGSPVEMALWTPNLWLSADNTGEAIVTEDDIQLTKTSDQKATRIASTFEPPSYPNRILIELDVTRLAGEQGTFTVWFGNGPNAFQKDIPLWMLTEGVEETIRISGITTEPIDPMYVLFQIAGEDEESVIINDARVFYSPVNN